MHTSCSMKCFNQKPNIILGKQVHSVPDYSLFVFIRVVFVSDRHELKFVSCSCRVRVWPVSCSCLIPQTRIEIRVVFVFAKFVSCKFVSDTDIRHDDTNFQGRYVILEFPRQNNGVYPRNLNQRKLLPEQLQILREPTSKFPSSSS
ncbi:hypothetical protein LXL04_029338 [Taraxacum kok-saghyz]